MARPTYLFDAATKPSLPWREVPLVRATPESLKGYGALVEDPEGFEVETAESVAGGKAIATARPPAYAVVDLRLEDGNGLDVVEVLRERRPDSRIVVLTGYGAIATAVAAVKIGATDYLSKPARPARIREKVDKYLGKRALRMVSATAVRMSVYRSPRSRSTREPSAWMLCARVRATSTDSPQRGGRPVIVDSPVSTRAVSRAIQSGISSRGARTPLISPISLLI